MHILNIMQCTNLGGTEHASLRLMQGMQQRGHSFQVVSMNSLGAFAPKLAENGIDAVGIPFRGKLGWRSYFRARQVLRSTQADAVVMTGPTLAGILSLRKRTPEPRVLAVHFHHAGRPLWAWRALYRAVLLRFQAVTFPSDFIRREALDIAPALESISHTLYNPIPLCSPPTPEDKVKARKRLGLPVGQPIVGNAGWLIRRKRFDVFLRVARSVLDRLPNAVFAIAGGGVLRDQLEQLSRDLNISQSIFWLGWQQNLEPFYRAIDVLLFNSDFDAMGLTPLEAAATGVPVVTSVIHGGLGEILGDGGAALLIQQHDIERLANSCAKLLSDCDYARKAGLVGRDRVAIRCSTAESVDKLEKVLRLKE